jgi:hypothetical protein
MFKKVLILGNQQPSFYIKYIVEGSETARRTINKMIDDTVQPTTINFNWPMRVGVGLLKSKAA